MNYLGNLFYGFFSKNILRCIYNGTIIQLSKNMGGFMYGEK